MKNKQGRAKRFCIKCGRPLKHNYWYCPKCLHYISENKGYLYGEEPTEKNQGAIK